MVQHFSEKKCRFPEGPFQIFDNFLKKTKGRKISEKIKKFEKL